MAGSSGPFTRNRIVALVALLVVLVAAVGVATLWSSPGGRATASGGEPELQGYTFVYHPGSAVTVVKQSFTDNVSRLRVVGPDATVSWTNASGGSTNMVARFDRRRFGATPGSTLRVEKYVQSADYWMTSGNSTVPNGPTSGTFVFCFHQKPALTVVNVDPNGTSTAHLALVGPRGSVSWANASLGSTRTDATFAWNRHALGAAAGDTVSLVRVDPSTGQRTTLRTATIP